MLLSTEAFYKCAFATLSPHKMLQIQYLYLPSGRKKKFPCFRLIRISMVTLLYASIFLQYLHFLFGFMFGIFCHIENLRTIYVVKSVRFLFCSFRVLFSELQGHRYRGHTDSSFQLPSNVFILYFLHSDFNSSRIDFAYGMKKRA